MTKGVLAELWASAERELAEELGIGSFVATPADDHPSAANESDPQMRFLGVAYRNLDFVPVTVFHVRFAQRDMAELRSCYTSARDQFEADAVVWVAKETLLEKGDLVEARIWSSCGSSRVVENSIPAAAPLTGDAAAGIELWRRAVRNGVL